jgi:hypothetical protein
MVRAGSIHEWRDSEDGYNDVMLLDLVVALLEL